MRTTLSSAALCLFCLVLISGAADGATADQKVVHHRASFSFEADLPSTAGYALILRASGHHAVELAVEREPGAEPYVTMSYRAPGHVGQDGVRADLGRFGRVDLHFVGRPHEERFHYPDCRPAVPEVTRYGVLEGLFEFEALDRKIKLTAHRVEGHTRKEPGRTCTPKPRDEFEGEPESFADRRPLAGEGKGEGVAADFSALAHTGGRTIETYAIRLNDEIGPGIVPDMAETRHAGCTGPVLGHGHLHLSARLAAHLPRLAHGQRPRRRHSAARGPRIPRSPLHLRRSATPANLRRNRRTGPHGLSGRWRPCGAQREVQEPDVEEPEQE